MEAICRSFSYFKYLSYWGLAFYFAFSPAHTLLYVRRRTDCLPFLVNSIHCASSWVGPWFAHHFDPWSAISIHVLNSVFASSKIVVKRTSPLPWLHLPVLLLIMTLYLGLAYLTKGIAVVYLYLWLDPFVGTGKIDEHIIGFGMAMLFIFALVRGAVWPLCRLTNRPSAPSVHLLRRIDRPINDNHDTSWTSRGIEMQKAASVKVDFRKVSLEAPTVCKRLRCSFNRTVEISTT